MNIRLCNARPHEEALFNKQMMPRLTGHEPKDRLMIQRWIEENNFKPAVLYDGNTIIRGDKIMTEFNRILKRGTLTPMTDYFYNFLSLDAGSIAHYNKHGWIEYYDNSAEALCEFFLHNEYGSNIVTNQPGWKTDCISIGNKILSIIEEKRSKAA